MNMLYKRKTESYSDILCSMSVNVTETIFYEQNLKHITIPIAKKNVIVPSCSQHDKFPQSRRNTL